MSKKKQDKEPKNINPTPDPENKPPSSTKHDKKKKGQTRRGDRRWPNKVY